MLGRQCRKMDVITFYFLQLEPGCASQRKYREASETSRAQIKKLEISFIERHIKNNCFSHYHIHPQPFLKMLAAHAGAGVTHCTCVRHKCKCSSLISCAGKRLSVCHYSGGFLSWAGMWHVYACILGCKLPSIERHL